MTGRAERALATRLAYRELRSHKLRSTLIALLVMLPLLAVTTGSVLLASALSRSEPGSTVLMTTAGADARLTGLGDATPGCKQTSDLSPSCEGTFEEVALRALPTLPRRTLVPRGTGTVILRHRGLETPVTVQSVDFRVIQIATYLPERRELPDADEVAISRYFADRHGVRVGSIVHLGSASYRVSQLVRTWDDTPMVLVGPDHPLAQPLTDVLVLGQISEPEKARLNTQGVAVLSRAAAQEMDDEVARLNTSIEVAWLTAVTTLVGVFAALLSCSLASAAFLIGIQQQRRTLSLLSITGASRQLLQGYIVRSGVLLGALGSVLGVTCGLGLGAALQHWLNSRSPGLPQSVSVPWLAMALLLCLGVGSAAVSVWLPARGILRADVVTGIREASLPSPAARRPWIGLRIALAGLAIGFLGARSAGAAAKPEHFPVEKVVLPGAVCCVLLFVGLLLSTGWVLDRLGRLTGLPLGLRLSLRDASRRRGRALACVASAVAVVALVGAGAVVFRSLGATERAEYQPHLRAGLGLLRLDGASALSSPQQQRAVAAVESVMGPVRWVRVDTPQRCGRTGECASAQMTPVDGQWSSSDDGPWVGDEKLYALLTGGPAPAEVRQALDQGRLVTSNPRITAGKKAGVLAAMPPGHDPVLGTPGADVPVFMPPTHSGVSPNTPAIIAPRHAARLDLGDVKPYALLVDLGRIPSHEEADAIRAELERVGIDADLFSYERGPTDSYWPVGRWFVIGGLVLLLLVAAITSSLTLLDGRHDLARLAGIGARAHTLRGMAATQCLVTMGLGALLGLVVGAVPMALVILSSSGMVLDVPWLWILALVGGVPIAAAVLVWLMATPPPPSARRTT